MKNLRLFSLMLTSLMLLLASGCATRPAAQTLYDLGPLPAAQGVSAGASLPPLALAEPVGPAFLDSPMMFYRLTYANDQQPRAFAESRWSMAPAQLLGQRFKARFGQAGSGMISAGDGATNVPVVRVETDDFTQVFDTPSHSVGQVRVRVAVFNGRILLAQKSFTQQRAASSADAAGGARALADASDTLITDVINWLGTLTLTPARR
jgi:cholesterol transport system auxiliary component